MGARCMTWPRLAILELLQPLIGSWDIAARRQQHSVQAAAQGQAEPASWKLGPIST